MVKAISRLNNKDIYAPIRKEIPKAHLRNLLQQRREMVPSLSESVREIELAYIATLGAKSKKIVTPQPHARKPKKKSKKSKKKVVRSTSTADVRHTKRWNRRSCILLRL